MGIFTTYICKECSKESQRIFEGVGMMGISAKTKLTVKDKMFKRGVCPYCGSTNIQTEEGLWD